MKCIRLNGIWIVSVKVNFKWVEVAKDKDLGAAIGAGRGAIL